MAVSLPTTANFVLGAANELFSARTSRTRAASYRMRAFGDLREAESYDIAQRLSQRNEQYAAIETLIKKDQATREATLGIGRLESDVAGAGLAMSGSALDLLRESSREGAMNQAILDEQGFIQREAFREQAAAYGRQAEAQRFAAGANMRAAQNEMTASRFHNIAGAIGAAFGVASLFA